MWEEKTGRYNTDFMWEEKTERYNTEFMWEERTERYNKLNCKTPDCRLVSGKCNA
jgi:hypothetical protein